MQISVIHHILKSKTCYYISLCFTCIEGNTIMEVKQNRLKVSNGRSASSSKIFVDKMKR